MAKAYISLGSNIGDRVGNLEKAIDLLNNNPKINISKSSSYYETKPVGYLNQANFINIVVLVETKLSPYELLHACQLIEEQLKRKRIKRWGPRTIDLDILLFDEYYSTDEELTIPHPRMFERAFVMIPLYEIAPKLKIQNYNIELIIKDLQTNLNHDEIKLIKQESISLIK